MQNNQITIFITYQPAELHEGKIWYINYYVINPATNKLTEKRIKFNRIKSITERRKAAKRIIQEINLKLVKGWNPFLEENAPKSFSKVTAALNIYLKSKKKELREDSVRTYVSMVKILNDWLRFSQKEDLLLINFNLKVTHLFADYLETREVGNRTYNNYIKCYRFIFDWLKSKQYIAVNPFHKISLKKKQNKSRVIIPPVIRSKIQIHLTDNKEIYFLAVCSLVFGSLIRPKEISYLQKKDFDFKNQIITIYPENAKSGNIRISTIPTENLEILNKCVKWAKPDEYIFGKGLNNSVTKECPRNYSRKWTELRKRLNLPITMKLYSLRDSGIVQLLTDGVSPHEVMRLAGHKDLTTTTAYLPYSNPTGSEIIKQKSRGF